MTLHAVRGSDLAVGLVEAGGWTIAVVPKCWSVGDERGWLSDGTSRCLVLRQGVDVVLPREMRHEVGDRLSAHLERQSEAEDCDDLEEADSIRTRALLSPGRSRTETRVDVGHSTATIDGLLHLLAWSIPDLDADQLGHARNDSLRRLLEQAFVSEIHKNLQWLRRGYVRHTAALGTARGRVDPIFAARSEATGLPRLTCTYDLFTEATPHFRVLTTALELVCASSVTPLQLVLTSRRERRDGFDRDTRRAALHLRNLFADILPLPVGEALYWATHVPLRPHLQARWGRALKLARAILAREAPASGDRDSPNPELSVPMASLFELWVEMCLFEAGVVVERQQSIEPPWTGVGSRRSVDLVATIEGSRILIDCKFKMLRDEHRQQIGAASARLKSYKQPPVADVNQIFAYAMLDRIRGGGVKAAALAYLPATVDDAVSRWRQATGPLALNRREEVPDIPLHVLRVPFPEPEVLTGNELPGEARKHGNCLKQALAAGSKE